MKWSALLLAGGQSSRMGQKKHMMQLEGRPMIDRQIDRFANHCEEILVVANDGLEISDEHVKVMPDIERFKGDGPLAGLYTGLKNSRSDAVCLIACDMPFASVKMASWLSEVLDEGYDAVIPRLKGRSHPLFACYHKRILPIVEEQLILGKRKMQDMIDRIAAREVQESEAPEWDAEKLEWILFNMNTPEDYETVRRKIEEGDIL
ncbi:molybdenum cofactor guanylyltransferase [Falsibacillus pallidus]|uniref:Probable molybdenum cofactor guanylyltransferase n=1 Tax=Falsibacillus pallidus TaxID=493781 RepID=A0A370GFA1_9BACI|nr:molybdenum cofactor guanylyltransferase [Falsibacillus pallidus]RDI41960.1 molybdenum cofactor guanylyltransferase [Falsibacillus pallidus]